ncbi:MAG: hypothetical protein H7249_04420 [Chitinophagaceae bacterium]|nr:hypothetical protein [Oligoflexus sp.]
MKASKLVSLFIVVGATSAHAAEADLYPVNTTVRDYAKRDRLLLGGLDYVSPSQLHENAGLRARLEGESQVSQIKRNGVQSNLQAPTVNGAVAYGWQDLTFGVRGGYTDAENKGTDINPPKEEYKASRVIPEISYTFGKYFTAGAGAEISQLDVTEKYQANNAFHYDYTRAIAGLSYHEPAYEIGVAYTSEVAENRSLDATAQRPGTSLSLTSVPTDNVVNQRAIYMPQTGTIFARGNVTDNVSLASAVSMARYDGNNEGAVHLFDNYKTADRLAANLVATYWTDARSRISAAAEYKGGASTEIGAEESGLGYRLSNLYGGSLEGILSINRMAYLGLNAEFLRGERNNTDTQTGVRYAGREETMRYSGFVTVKL